MFGFITYLAQSALCLVALYIIYKATMSHETLHRLNRVTLLMMVVLSAVLPMCRIKIVQEVETVLTPIVDDMSATAVAVDAALETVDYRPIMEDALVVIFLLGAAFMVVRLAMSWLSVWRVVRSGESRNLTDGVTLSIVEKLSSPFSWFRHVVVSRADMDENRDMILEHELAHVRFGHSWDVLFVDLALIMWWFNPAMWLLRRELQSLHEYQADDAVLNRGIDAKTYQLLLIKRAVGSRLHSVANCLNHSNLKNRITMMCRKQSSRWQSAKLLLVLPMVAISLAATATTVYVETRTDDKVIEKNEKNKEISNVRLEGDKIYLNDKEVSMAELEKHFEGNKGGALNIRFADNKAIENSAKFMEWTKELARKNERLKITFEQVKFQAAEESNEPQNNFAQEHVKNMQTSQQQKPQKKEAEEKPEKMPTFQGGDLSKFVLWLQTNVKYPAEAVAKGIQGRVIFSFVVNKDGSVGSFEALKSPDKSLTDEVERVFNTSPKWEPAEQDGKKVNVKFTVPVIFINKNK